MVACLHYLGILYGTGLEHYVEIFPPNSIVCTCERWQVAHSFYVQSYHSCLSAEIELKRINIWVFFNVLIYNFALLILELDFFTYLHIFFLFIYIDTLWPKDGKIFFYDVELYTSFDWEQFADSEYVYNSKSQKKNRASIYFSGTYWKRMRMCESYNNSRCSMSSKIIIITIYLIYY